MVLSTWWGWGNAASIAVSVVLAFAFGYALTMSAVLRAGVSLGAAVRVALAADTISILVMEVFDNLFMLLVPGAIDATLADGLFWISLAGALLVAFLTAWPVNRALISRGRGHAVMHAYH